MPGRTLQVLAASTIAVCTAACVNGDDAATTEPERVETTESAGATQSTSTPEPGTTAPTGEPDVAVVAASTSWSPVLDVPAVSPPPTASCDTTNSDVAGELGLPDFMAEPLGPEPPTTGWFAAFESKTHSVTVIGQYGDGERVAAGSLDVCTDTWSPISSVLQHPDTGATGYKQALVYDVDSDAMVAYTSEGVFVYASERDEWQHHPVPRSDSGLPEVLSAAYHPASGMIIVADANQLLAHDIDTDEWLPIATFPDSTDELQGAFIRGRLSFLGVHAGMDRLMLTEQDTTRLTDPVTGEAMVIKSPDFDPNVDHVWSSKAYGPAGGTVFVTDDRTGDMCGFDADTLAWDHCFPSGADASWAIVGDPINDRLLAISTSTIETWPLPQP